MKIILIVFSAHCSAQYPIQASLLTSIQDWPLRLTSIQDWPLYSTNQKSLYLIESVDVDPKELFLDQLIDECVPVFILVLAFSTFAQIPLNLLNNNMINRIGVLHLCVIPSQKTLFDQLDYLSVRQMTQKLLMEILLNLCHQSNSMLILLFGGLSTD